MDDDRTAGSLCSGVGGLDLGLHRAGWRTSWFCEKDARRRRILDRHWPGIPAHPDICTLDPADLAPVRLLAGGTPCTDLSVAGRREGLGGDESRLFWEFMRIRNAIEPEWTLWENVEGALSSNEGLDFALVLGAFVGADVAVPGEGWGGAGVVAGPWGGAVWRVLNAQHFGVPQRRKRVFVVGCLGGPCPPEVLLEPAGGGGDLAQSGEAWPRVAAPLTRGSSRAGVSEPGRRLEDDFNIVKVADTVRSHPRPGSNSSGAVVPTLTRRYGKGSDGKATDGFVVGALDAQRGGPDDNSAQAGHLVEVPRSLAFSSVTGDEQQVSGTIDRRSRNGPMQNQEASLILANTLKGQRGKGGGGIGPEETLITHALTSEGFDASEDGTGRGTPLALHLTQTPVSGEQSPTLGSEARIGVSDAGSVRRLTPTECERLMGWPDGFTLDRGPSLLDTLTYANRHTDCRSAGQSVLDGRPDTGSDLEASAEPRDPERANRSSRDPGSRGVSSGKPEGRGRTVSGATEPCDLDSGQWDTSGGIGSSPPKQHQDGQSLDKSLPNHAYGQFKGRREGWSLSTSLDLHRHTASASLRSSEPGTYDSTDSRADGHQQVSRTSTSLVGDSCAVDPQPDGYRYAACGDGVVAHVSEWIGRRIHAVDEGRALDA